MNEVNFGKYGVTRRTVPQQHLASGVVSYQKGCSKSKVDISQRTGNTGKTGKFPEETKGKEFFLSNSHDSSWGSGETPSHSRHLSSDPAAGPEELTKEWVQFPEEALRRLCRTLPAQCCFPHRWLAEKALYTRHNQVASSLEAIAKAAGFVTHREVPVEGVLPTWSW